MIALIEEACTAGARLAKACKVVGVSVRTVQRYRRHGEVKPDGRKAAAAGRVPANRLSEQERTAIVETANQPEFAHLPPSQIVPALADEGCYLASESSFYRVLRAKNQLTRRGRVKAPSHSRPQALEATAPNQLWSWDITYLATTVRGLFFYLYLILDVYSRKIVGWEVYAEESADHAASTFRKSYLREGIAGQSLILHRRLLDTVFLFSTSGKSSSCAALLIRSFPLPEFGFWPGNNSDNSIPSSGISGYREKAFQSTTIPYSF